MSASYSLTIFREEILKTEALKNISNAETVAIPPVVKLVLPGVQKKGGTGRLADYREIHVCICMRQGRESCVGKGSPSGHLLRDPFYLFIHRKAVKM